MKPIVTFQAEWNRNVTGADKGLTLLREVVYPAMSVTFQCPVCEALTTVSRGKVYEAETTGQCACLIWYWVDWQKGEVTQR